MIHITKPHYFFPALSALVFCLSTAYSAEPSATQPRLPILPPSGPHVVEDRFEVISPNFNESSIDSPLAAGQLLTAADPALRPPDLLFILHAAHLHVFNTAKNTDLTPPQTRDSENKITTEGGILLPETLPTTLVGCVGDLAILNQAKSATAINLKTLAIVWTAPITTDPPEKIPPTTLRIAGDKLLILSGNQLTALTLATGKSAWTIDLPKGTPSLVALNKTLATIQLTPAKNSSPPLNIYDLASSNLVRQIQCDSPILWSALSPDGLLFVLSAKTLAAYDPHARPEPLWTRDDLHSKFPDATALTPDSLLLINGYSDVVCLSPSTGETRWPAKASDKVILHFQPFGQQPRFIRSTVHGDTIYFQSQLGVIAIHIAPQPAGEQLAWVSNNRLPSPDLQSMELSDPYAVVLGWTIPLVTLSAPDPDPDVTRVVRIVLFKCEGGKCYLDLPLRRDAGSNEGPLIRNWQVADNGIAFEINEQVFFYRSKIP